VGILSTNDSGPEDDALTGDFPGEVAARKTMFRSYSGNASLQTLNLVDNDIVHTS
jgi:hypothetical protein